MSRSAWTILLIVFLLPLAGCQSPGAVSFYHHKPLVLPAPASEESLTPTYDDQNSVMRGQIPGSVYDFPRIENSIASLSKNSVPSNNTGSVNSDNANSVMTNPYPATTPVNQNNNLSNGNQLNNIQTGNNLINNNQSANIYNNSVNSNSAYNSSLSGNNNSATGNVSVGNVNPMNTVNQSHTVNSANNFNPVNNAVAVNNVSKSSGYSSSGQGGISVSPTVSPYPAISVPMVNTETTGAPSMTATPTVTGASGTGVSSGNSSTVSSGSSVVSQPGIPVAMNNVGSVTTPPSQNNLPRFARNSYDNSLENVETNAQGRIVQPSNPSASSRPEPNRQSLTDKVQVEKELEAKYQQWLKSQKTAQKEKSSKSNSYLEPLSDDRAVFTDPNSPFARKTSGGKDKRFVREITAADLSMMSDVSSKKELLDWEKEEAMPVDWSKYSAKTLWSKWRDFAGMSPNEKEASVVMKEAAAEHAKYEEDKNKKHLTKASDLYEKAGRRWPDSVLEEDALFYAGECCFFSENYPRAMRCYKQLVSKYANSVLKKQAIERLYYIGCYWVKCSEETSFSFMNLTDEKKPTFSSFAGAKNAFEAVYLNDTSDNGRAPDALFALANAYMRRASEQGDASFESAARYYRQLYEFYPACKHTEKAYQLAIIALHKSYRGPSYDSRSLKQAAEIAKAAQAAGKGDQKLIQEELDNIKGEQATQLMFRGKYYEKRGNYASARAYYNRIVRDFPGHELSEVAAKRYAEIKDRPAEIDQYAWIRPVMPFIPKSDNVYYEDHPEKQVRAAIVQRESQEASSPDQVPENKISDLDKTKSENKKKLY